MLAIRKPYAVFLGDAQDHILAKTAYGLRDWARQDCLAQIREPASVVDLGLPDTDVPGARALGAESIVIGIAPDGGQLPRAWRPALLDALDQGMDVVSGLHERLADDPELAEAARSSNCRILDIRHSTSTFPIGNGASRQRIPSADCRNGLCRWEEIFCASPLPRDAGTSMELYVQGHGSNRNPDRRFRDSG